MSFSRSKDILIKYVPITSFTLWIGKKLSVIIEKNPKLIERHKDATIFGIVCEKNQSLIEEFPALRHFIEVKSKLIAVKASKRYKKSGDFCGATNYIDEKLLRLEARVRSSRFFKRKK